MAARRPRLSTAEALAAARRAAEGRDGPARAAAGAQAPGDAKAADPAARRSLLLAGLQAGIQNANLHPLFCF
eukprot:7794890-Alexandrium_andersonii.AAC.1